MTIYVTVVVILISTYVVNASLLEPVVENIVHYEAKEPPKDVQGVWRKKTVWKPRWVKEWKSSKVTKPVWRKIWSPVHIKEWVPIPKPPPEWNSKSKHIVPVKTTTKNIPFWDPMPYPESQQPPPPPQITNNKCNGNECDDSFVKTFTQEQIAKIIGAHRQKKTNENFPSDDHQEWITQLTKIPTDSENWRFPRQSSFHNDYFPFSQDPSQYLVPPKYQAFVTDFSFYFANQKKPLPKQSFHTSTIKPQIPTNHLKSVENLGRNQWTPIQNQKQLNYQTLNLKPTNLNKFQASSNNDNMSGNLASNNQKQNTDANGSVRNQSAKSVETTTTKNFQVNTDFIQQADLIGEYHYSDFDLYSKIKPNTNFNFKQELMFKPLSSTTHNQSFVSTKFKSLPQETSSKLLQEIVSNARIKPIAVPKFKPLVSETALPNLPEKIKQIKPQIQSQNATKPRPTRKDTEFLQHENEIQRFILKPEILYEQEKAIMKEILPSQQSTSTPFPDSHRFASNPVFRSLNSTTPKNLEQINNVGKNFHLYFVYPEEKNNSKSDSETNLIKALQKSGKITVKTDNVTENGINKTTQLPLPTSSSSTLADSKTEVATKSPVFIVTPTYVEKS